MIKMMTRDEYVAAIDEIFLHDQRVKKVLDVSQALAREVGDDFGGLAIIPEPRLRVAFIKLVETMAGDHSGLTRYLVDECVNMKDGGSLHLVDGRIFIILNAIDCWNAIQVYNDIKIESDNV